MKARTSAVVLCALLVGVLAVPSAWAQDRVNIQINVPQYDVVYLSDIVDVTTGKLKDAIPNVQIIFTLSGVPELEVYMQLLVEVQLKGESREYLVRAETEPFWIRGTKIVTSADLKAAADKRGDLKLKPSSQGGYEENKSLRDRIETYAQRFPTAPVGNYFISLKVLSGRNTVEGTQSLTLTIRNASESEVQVTLNQPDDNSEVPTILPTFSWSAENPEAPVTLSVFEMLPIHRSPAEATSGIPHLVAKITGTNTFTYPPSRSAAPPNVTIERFRQLEQGKRYVWFVSKDVKTNRGTIQRTSTVYRFSVAGSTAGGGTTGGGVGNPILTLLENYAARAGGPVQAFYDRLLTQQQWRPTGRIRIDGQTVTLPTLKVVVDSLINNGTQVQLRFE